MKATFEQLLGFGTTFEQLLQFLSNFLGKLEQLVDSPCCRRIREPDACFVHQSVKRDIGNSEINSIPE